MISACLVENAGDETKRVPRFAKYLLKALVQGDEAGMKLVARAIAYLIQTSKTFAAELVEKSINQVKTFFARTLTLYAIHLKF